MNFFILISFLLIYTTCAARIPNKHFLHHSHVNKTSDSMKSSNQVASKYDYEIYNPKLKEKSSTSTRKLKTHKLNTSATKLIKYMINDSNKVLLSSTLMTRQKNRNQRKKINTTYISIKNEGFENLNNGRFMGFMFNDSDDFFIKQSLLTNFLSKSKYFLSKLEKEAEIVENDFRFFGKKYYHLLRSKLKSAYEEMRRYLCNAFEFDDGPADSAMLLRNDMNDEDKKRRRLVRYSEKRLFKKICSK